MSIRGVRSRPEFVGLLLLALVAPLLLLCWVHGDGIAYVAMLRSAVVDRDLALADEYAHLSTHLESDAVGFPARFFAAAARGPGIDPTYHTPAPDPVTGRVPAFFAVGPALAWLPGYLLADRLAPPGLDRAVRGYGRGWYVAIALTSLAAGLTGIVLAIQLAATVAARSEAAWAGLAMVGATPLLYYLYLAPSYAHALSVLACAAFYLHASRTRGSDRAGTWLARGVLTGVLFLTRWSDVVLALPVLAVEGAALLRRDPRGTPARLAAALAGFALAAWPQFALWQYFHGRPWVRHPEALVGLIPEGLWGTFFSPRHGLFTWTPLTLAAVWGLARLWRRDRWLAGSGLAAIALLAFANASVVDWWGGSSFGMRRMIAATPLLAVGLAAWCADARAALAARAPGFGAALAPAVVIAFTAWNALLVLQYALGMIPHDAPVTLATLARQQPEALARLGALVTQVLR